MNFLVYFYLYFSVPKDVPMVPTLSPIYPDNLPESVITLASTESTRAQFFGVSASIFEVNK